MALYIRQTAIARHPKSQILAKVLLIVSAITGILSLSACQTAPNVNSINTVTKTTTTQTVTSSPTPNASTVIVRQAPIVKKTNDKAQSTEQTTAVNPLTKKTPPLNAPASVSPQPDNSSAPTHDDYMISEPSVPSHNELLERARKNSQQQGRPSTSSNDDLPAFRNLMQAGISQLNAGRLTSAESSFTRAQRVAPKSSSVYFYLAQVALKKNQPRKAEAMARRGLSTSQDASRRRSLWKLILQSGQAQGNSRVINEAKQALR